MNSRQCELLGDKGLKFNKVTLSDENDQLVLSCETAVHMIKFYNVSRLSIRDLSLPLEVDGIEVIDHSQMGWDKDSRFEIYDYEDGRIHFFCEDYKIE